MRQQAEPRMVERKTDSVGWGGGELSGRRVFRDFSRAKERSSRQRDPKVEKWKGLKLSGDGEGGGNNSPNGHSDSLLRPVGS